MTDVSKMSDEELIAESREWCAVSTMWQDRINIELASRLEVTGPLEKERDGLRAAVGAFLEVQGPCHEAEDDPPAMCDHPTCTYCNMQRALRQPEGEETT